jgi:hypothetical protein
LLPLPRRLGYEATISGGTVAPLTGRIEGKSMFGHPNETAIRALSQSPKLISEWLGKWQFDRFITLTFNDAGDAKPSSASATASKMRKHLRDWDARMNRMLIGRDWLKRQDNRMFHFFTPEKITTNPHWHGLVSFFGADEPEKIRQGRIFDENAERIWKFLVPSGTADVKIIDDQAEFISYVAKSVCLEVNYGHFIVQDEFLTK